MITTKIKIYAWPDLVYCFPDELKDFLEWRPDDWFPVEIPEKFIKNDEKIEELIIKEIRELKDERN